MSYDELPPDETARPDNEGAAPSPEAEASVADAPVTAASRPRRTRRTETAAASAPEIAEPLEKPARAARTRRKPSTSNQETETIAPQPLTESTVPPAIAEVEKPVPKPKTTRTRRKPPAEETVAAPVDAVAAAPAEEAATVLESPAAPKRRTRRTKAEVEAETVDAPSEKPATKEPSVAATETETPPTARQRTPRGRKKSVDPAPEKPVSEPTPVTSKEETATETPVEPKSARRRTRRTKAEVPTEAETPQTVEAVTEAEAESEPAETSDASETEERRGRRRNRRGGRARRGRTNDRTEIEAETAVAGVAAVEEEPVAVEPEDEPVDTSIGSHLIRRNGVPQIHINGKPFPPVFFFGNMEGNNNRVKVMSEVRKAAKAGVHLHSTLVDLPCPLTEASHALDEIDARLKSILDMDPNGFVMPRVLFYPAKGWKREYPTEFASYADGTTGDPSFTSERFWQEAERSLEMLITHIQGQEWGRRVFGYHLERGEWFQPADLGYDRSNANRDAFRDWLRVKYKDDLVRLRAAWYNGEAQFHTAEIPTPIAKPNPQQAFYEMRRQRNTIDFQEFTSDTTANRLIRLAKVVKKATDRQALVSACYGYTLEFGHGYSGHLALSKILQSPVIDLLTGPPSYRDRKPGGAASLPAPTDSMRLYGKLWLSEDDTKTYLAPTQADDQDYNPRLPDKFLTEQAHIRALGKAIANRSGVGFMDLWGEGWLDDEGLWSQIETLAAQYEKSLNADVPLRTPDVVALIDEGSLLHLQRGEPFFRKLTADFRNTLQRAGISFALHLQTDLLAEAFPTDAKLYLFLTPYRLPAEIRAAIKEKLQNGNKTLAFLYAPGTCDSTPFVSGVMDEGATAAVGITLRPQEWNAEVGTRFIEQNHALTQSLPGRDLGNRERLNPSFYVDDPEAVTLGEYVASGMPSVAVKNCGTWKSVFIGEPTLPLELLRGVCRYAGVPVWTPRGDDVTLIGNGWVTIHSGRDGQRSLVLPKNFSLYDLTENRLVLENGRDYRWFQRGGSTHQFCYGTREQFAALGFANLNTQERRRIVPDERAERRPFPAFPPASAFNREEPREEPTAQAENVSEDSLAVSVQVEAETLEIAAAPIATSTVSEDLRTLEAVLNMNLSEIGDELPLLPDNELRSDFPTTVTAPQNVSSTLEGLLETDISGAAKRRRRRGGRGRGRRRADGTEEPTDENDTEDNSEPGDGTEPASSAFENDESI